MMVALNLSALGLLLQTLSWTLRFHTCAVLPALVSATPEMPPSLPSYGELRKQRRLSLAEGKSTDDDEVGEDVSISTTATSKSDPSPYGLGTTKNDEATGKTTDKTATGPSSSGASKPKITLATKKVVLEVENNATNSGNMSDSVNATSESEGNATQKPSYIDDDDVTFSSISQWTFNNKSDTHIENATKSLLLPPEDEEQPENFHVAVMILFVGIAIVMCAMTAWRKYGSRNRRNYEPIETLVV